jgi:hypothetical protein
MVNKFGSEEFLAIEITWADEPGATAVENTRGVLRLWAAGVELWPGNGYGLGLEWTWVELAEFLAGTWQWLTWENGLPFDLHWGPLPNVRADVERRWRQLSMSAREVEEEEFYNFQERHDLARAVSGAVLPPVWVVRDGDSCWIATEGSATPVAFHWVADVLAGFVEAVLSRLDGLSDARSRRVREVWESRLSVAVADVVDIATGLDRDVLAELSGSAEPAAFWELDPGDSVVISELVAAARMTAGLPVADMATVLAAIRSSPAGARGHLDELAARLSEDLPALADSYPYDQGYLVADWLRELLHVDLRSRVDPADLLATWGVQLNSVGLLTTTVDAIACWGPRHGPAIFVNDRGQHNQYYGRRATLAHEIAHLLLDRREALPLAEVMDGRSRSPAEERARAFAAQFLLPKDVAGERLAGASADVMHVVRQLQGRYQVSQEIIAWQARNSSVALPAAVRARLRGLVSQPSRF